MKFVVQKTHDKPGYRLDVYTHRAGPGSHDNTEWIAGGFYSCRTYVCTAISQVLFDESKGNPIPPLWDPNTE